MDFSSFENIVNQITNKFNEDVITASFPEAKQPYIEIAKDKLLSLCQFLYTEKSLYFDLLNCITVHDNGPEKGNMEVWYHLTSIPYEKSFIIKVLIDRGSNQNLPSIDSVSSIWRTADWHEREAFDLLGLKFLEHPDLRRILMPADWVGYPLRKDYEEPEKYHGIKVKY